MLYVKSKKFLLGFCFFVLISFSSFGQVAGDFRSVASANWNVNTTWQSFNGTAWVAAVAAPTAASGTITIQSPNVVSISASFANSASIIVNSGSTLRTLAGVTLTNNAAGIITINGTLINSATLATGTIINNGVINNNLTLTNNGVFTNNLTLNTATGSTTTQAGAFTNAATGTINNIGTLTINATKTLTNNGILTNSGTITTTGTLINGAGSFYKHNFSSAAATAGVIPTATWNATSTCEIQACGNVGPPTGLSQTFGNFTWNNTTQPLDINLNGALTTIGGNFTMTSSGAFGIILKTVIGGNTTVSGNFSMTGGKLVVAQIIAPANTTNQLSISGTYAQSGGTMVIANSSGTLATNTGNGTLSVGLTSAISGGIMNVCTSTWVGAGGNGTFASTGLITLSGTGTINGCSSNAALSSGASGTITASAGITINAGGTLNLNTSTTTGGGGSTSLAANGLITLSGGIINGSSATATGITGCNSTIQANAGLTINGGTLNLTPGNITGGGGTGFINVTGALAISAGTVNLNTSTATAGTTGSNGTISVSSTCTISGTATVNVTSSTTTGGGGSGTINVTGAFSMSAGTLNLCSTSGAGTGNGTLDVTGACTFSGTSLFNITSSTTTSATSGKGIVNVGGNFSHTTAAASFARTATLATATGTININGSVAQTIESTNGFSGTAITFNISQALIAAAKTTIPLTKSFVVNSGTTLNVNDNSLNTGYDLQITSLVANALKVSGIMNVNSLATLDVLANVISDAATGAGTFNLISDASLITKHPQGIALLGTAQGSIQVTGARSYSTGADYTYNSSTTSQITGLGLPASLTGTSNLTINNTYYPASMNAGGVTLSQATTTLGTLTLTAQRLITTAATLMTIDNIGTSSPGFLISQSNFSFVDGPIKKIGNSAFIFPTGDLYNITPAVGYVTAAKWARIAITAPTNITDAFTAEYHKIDDPCDVNQAISNTNVPALNHVSYKEYWDLTRTTAAAVAPTVTLYWEDGSEGTSLGSGIFSPTAANLTVAEFYSSTWNNLGAGTITGGLSYTPGNIKASLAGVFTTGTAMNFTFGAPTTVNPLPIELLTFNGYSAVNGNQLFWSTATETNSSYFDLEKSDSGNDFTKIASIQAAGNSTSQKNYTYLDAHPFIGTNYYRLKEVDYNGEFTYSSIISIDNNTSVDLNVTVYPNPSTDAVNISSSGNIASITIYNMLGELVYSTDERSVQFTPQSKGVYVINAISKEGKTSTTRFVKN